MQDFKDTNDVKNSKSCPVIYKVFKQTDGTTVHELLSEDLSKGLRLNKPANERNEQETPMHHKPLRETEKLNIILDENGKSSLYDYALAASEVVTKLENNKKDMKQHSFDSISNSANKFDLSLQSFAACDSSKRGSNSLDDDVPSTSASASSYSVLTTPSSPNSASCTEN